MAEIDVGGGKNSYIKTDPNEEWRVYFYINLHP